MFPKGRYYLWENFLTCMWSYRWLEEKMPSRPMMRQLPVPSFILFG